MTAKVTSATAIGFNGHLIEIEADLKKGLPSISIVGLGNKAIEESKDRVRSAILNSMLSFPSKKITINLAPASLPKDGAHFDLPIALAILMLEGQLRQDCLKSILCAGELSLDGRVRSVKGIINIVETARENGFKKVIIPSTNLDQASLIKDIEIIPVEKLIDAFLFLAGEKKIEIMEIKDSPQLENKCIQFPIDIADIHGQDHAKRAMLIAAAGGHNILLDGPPGSGKTMLAKALVSILPELTYEEQIAITKLHSLSDGSLDNIMTSRPFRSPHHTASQISLIGGGTKPMPGEVSLAHCGVLFLDEIPEYSKSALESLRQPLEDDIIHISRASSRVSYPASFMLVATKNPCPCGYFGDLDHECICSMPQILNYQKKLSGPLLDRIDMIISVSKVNEKDLLRKSTHPESPKIRKELSLVRKLQIERNSGIINAKLPSKNIVDKSFVSEESIVLLNSASQKLKLSARSYFKIIKVARTIADLDKSKHILPKHISEALQYRQKTSLSVDL